LLWPNGVSFPCNHIEKITHWGQARSMTNDRDGNLLWNLTPALNRPWQTADLVKRTTRIFAVQPPRDNWQYGTREKSEIQNTILPGKEAGAGYARKWKKRVR